MTSMLIILARSHLPNYHTQLNIAGPFITNSSVLEGPRGNLSSELAFNVPLQYDKTKSTMFVTLFSTSVYWAIGPRYANNTSTE